MKHPVSSRITHAMVWALVIIAAAFLFKGSPSQAWIEAGLIGVALVFVALKPITKCI